MDLCQLGLRDADSGKPHKKATGVGTDSPGIQAVMRSVPRCDGRHEHQVLEKEAIREDPGRGKQQNGQEDFAEGSSEECNKILRR